MKNQNTKLYQITDIRASLLSDYPIIEAKNSRAAILIYRKQLNQNFKFIRGGDNDCVIKTEPFYYENGIKYRDGKSTWYKIIN